MSFLDSIRGSLGGVLGSGALAPLIEKFLPGGLQAVLDQLTKSGLGAQVNSWLGRGPNEPITAEDLRAALSDEQIREFATRLGLPVDQLLELLAGQLPEAVDQHSPDGELRTPDPEAAPKV